MHAFMYATSSVEEEEEGRRGWGVIEWEQEQGGQIGCD